MFEISSSFQVIDMDQFNSLFVLVRLLEEEASYIGVSVSAYKMYSVTTRVHEVHFDIVSKTLFHLLSETCCTLYHFYINIFTSATQSADYIALLRHRNLRT